MPLTPEEEKRLVQEMMEGREEARKELISHLEPLIRSIAQKLCKRYDCWKHYYDDYYDDLVSEGRVAAIKAVDEFDPCKGARLSTFAYPRIKGAMTDFLIKEWCRGIHASRHLLRLAFRVKEAHDEIMAKKDDMPTPEEIAQYLSISEDEAREYLDVRGRLSPEEISRRKGLPLVKIEKLEGKIQQIEEKENRKPSLEELKESVTVEQVEEALGLLEFIEIESLDEIMKKAEEEGYEWEPPSKEPSPEEKLIQEEENQAVNKALERLDPKDREILKMKYWENLSYEEIAKKLGITVDAVKSRLHRARERFKSKFMKITGAKSPQKKRRKKKRRR